MSEEYTSLPVQPVSELVPPRSGDLVNKIRILLGTDY